MFYFLLNTDKCVKDVTQKKHPYNINTNYYPRATGFSFVN